MKTCIARLVVVVAVGVVTWGCATQRPSIGGFRMAPGESPSVVLSEQEWNAEAISIQALSVGLQRACSDIAEVCAAERSEFTNHETERCAGILFRFTIARDGMLSKITRHGNADPRSAADLNLARSLITAFTAAAAFDRHSSAFVETCLADKDMVGKLNEAFFSYGLEEDTFDEIFYSVTSPQNMAWLKQVAELLKQERVRKGSSIWTVTTREPVFAAMLDTADADLAWGLASTERILAKKAFLLPGLVNILRQNAIAENMRTTGRKVSRDLYRCQGWLFNSVSDIRTPGAGPIDFNPKQVAAVKSRLRAGDLILTYTAGYMSNVFLPGNFKHGIVYVGLPAERRDLGLKSMHMQAVSAARMKEIRSDMDVGALDTGYDADVIEAVAEGVKFSSLDYLMKTHINRMVVLRPKITDEERRDYLIKVFALRGSMYDFDFDFEDATYQCCTEVIYRALNGKGGLDFPLKQRLAMKTLSADDIITHHKKSGGKHFDVILLAEENPESPIHGATLVFGSEAEERLSMIMEGKTVTSSLHASR